MTSIITRSTGSSPKGSPLTASELDGNFINLNQDKVEFTRAINTTAGDLTGGGDLSGDRTLGLASTGISAGTVNNSTTQLTPLTLDIKGRVTGVGTPQTLTPAFSSLTGKPTTLAGYGITDAQATITGAATTIDTENLAASKVLVSDGSGKVAASDISTTTLGYLDATSSVQGQLDSKQATTAKNAANGYAGLDANAKLPTSLLPALAISEYLGSVANQAARLALTGQKGDWCSQTNDGKVYVITGDDPTDNANWTALTYPVTPGITLNGTSIAPGDTATISAATTNTLTIGTGLSGTSFNGSSAVTIAIDSSVVTLTGTQTLTNKTLTSPAISGGTANNVAIGGTTPAAGAFTTLSSTGNTTLGDANTDTLTINGTAVSAPNGLNVNSNQLVLSGGNVGIGANAPAEKLEVLGGAVASRAASSSTTAGIWAQATDYWSGATYRGVGLLQYGSASTGTTAGLSNANLGTLQFQNGSAGLIQTNGAAPLVFGTLSAERLRIDSSGNVGIGTSSPTQKLQLAFSTNDGNGTVFTNTSTGNYFSIIVMGTNAYGVTDWQNSTVFEAVPHSTGGLVLGSYTGSIKFQTGVRSTRMTLDSSGNLGLGVTPSAWATVKALQISGGASLGGYNNGSYLYTNAYYDGSTWRYIASSVGASGIYQYNGGFSWYTASSGTAGNAITFTQAMTLDASGNLIVGDTSGPTNARFYAVHSVSNAGVGFIRGASTSYTDSVFTVSSATASGTGFNLLRLQHATGTCCQVLGNGNVQNTNNSYGAISDKSLKENIVDATPKLANLLRVKIRNFNLIGDSTKQIGVVAQELEEVFPAMVEEDGDGVKSVKYSVFVPMLVKAIQELHAEIETLKQRIH